MARRTSYPNASSFVRNPVPPTVTPSQFGWFPKWQDPVRQLVAAAAVFVAFCPQPPPQLPVTPKTVPAQAQQASPTLLAARTAHNHFAWDPQTPPSLPVTPSTLVPAAHQAIPIRQPVSAAPNQYAWSPEAIFTSPNFGWNTLQFQPVLIPSRAPDPIYAWVPKPLALPVTPTSFGFQAQQFSPTLLPARAPDSVYIYDPQVIIFTTPVPYGWAAKEFAPRLLAPRALDAQFAWNPQKLSLPVTPSQFGFYQPFHEIVRTPARSESSITFVPQFVVPVVIVDGWRATEAGPVFQRGRATDSPYIWTPQPLKLPVTPSQLGFWKPFHEIVRTPERRDPVFAWQPQPIFPPILYGWWTPQYASDPVRLRVGATPSDLIWTPEPIQLPVTPSQFGWWVPWRDPVRTLLRGDVSSPWSPQTPIPFRHDWLVSPYQSSIPSLVCSFSSTVPALVCYGGAVVENETYMSTLLPFQIQQPFNLFPGNGIPIQWQVILGSTWNNVQTPVTDATGTLTIYDPDGNEVYTVPFTYIGGTTYAGGTYPLGLYQAMIDGPSFNPTPGNNYKSVISLTSPTVAEPGLWTIATNIRVRTTP